MASKDRRAEPLEGRRDDSFRRLIRRPGTSLTRVMEPGDSSVPPLASASISPRGNALLLSGSDNRRLSIRDMAQGTDRVVSTAPGSGVGAAWSPGGDRVIYKEVDLESGGERVMVYDIATGHATELGKDGIRCGVPVYSAAGKAGFASGNDLYIYGEDLMLEKTIPLGFEAARLAFSADGSAAACVGAGAGVSIVDVERGETRPLVSGRDVDYTGARFSPDGASLLLGTAGGEVVVADTASGETRSLGRGSDAQWIEGGRRVLVLRNRGLVADGVDSSQVCVLGGAGGEEVILESDTVKLSGISISPDERTLTCVTEQGAVLVFELGGGKRE